jgi:glyoxylase-like metal-dependent hydrolase (beta-lactamase superfamily II)
MGRLILIAALLLAVSQEQATAAQNDASDLVAQAVAAQGGANALRGLTAIEVMGDASFWGPGQSYVAGGEPRFFGTGKFEITWNLETGMARTKWDRDQQYPPPAAKAKYTETVLPTLGFVTDSTGSKPMSGIRVATHLRELERSSPRLLLKAMNDAGNVRMLESQRLGDRSLPTVSYADGPTSFIILFDPETHLPAAIRTRDEDNMSGDSNYDLILADWTSAGSAKVATSLSYRLNGTEVAKLHYAAVMRNPALPNNAFAVSETVMANAKPPANGNIPYQWVIRRLFLNRFLDSDAIIYPDGGGLKLVELAPNVQHVQGGTANSLIVAMKDFLVVFDAPYGERQSRWTIDAAKAKYPGKPIRYLVLTHHHMDHAGGLRTYVAEGATLIVPVEARDYFKSVVAAAHTIFPDELQKNPRTPVIYGLYEVMSIKDETDEIRIYNMDTADREDAPRLTNSHSADMLMGHVLGSKLLYVTDLISPRGGPIERSDLTIAVGDDMREQRVEGTDFTFVGGHGATATYAEVAPALVSK